MTTITQQIEQLVKVRDEIENRRIALSDQVEAERSRLEERERELNGLAAERTKVQARIETMEQLGTQIDGVSATLADSGSLGQDEADQGRRDHEALVQRLARELSDEKRQALTRAVEGVDDNIAAAKDAADRAGVQLQDAELAAAKAQGAASAAEREYVDALTNLHSLPQQLEESRAHVSTSRAAAKDAMEAGRIAEALVLARELRAALDDLTTALDPAKRQELVSRLPALWEAANSASAEFASASEEVGRKRDALSTARSTYEGLVQERDNRIKERIKDPETPRPPDSVNGPTPSSPDAEPTPASPSPTATSPPEHADSAESDEAPQR